VQHSTGLKRAEGNHDPFARRQHQGLVKDLAAAQVDRDFPELRGERKILQDRVRARGTDCAGIERNHRDIVVAARNLAYPHEPARLRQRLARGWTVGEQIDRGRAVRPHHRRRQHRGARGNGERVQRTDCTGKRRAPRGERRKHPHIERVADNAELLIGSRGIDQRERLLAGLVQPGNSAVGRAHRGTDVEHQRMRAAAPHPCRQHHVKPSQREHHRAERGEFQPEQEIEPHVTNAGDRGGRLVEQHQAGNFQRGTRARAQVDREQDRKTGGPQKFAWD
jgi:hypothetical protein